MILLQVLGTRLWLVDCNESRSHRVHGASVREGDTFGETGVADSPVVGFCFVFGVRTESVRRSVNAVDGRCWLQLFPVMSVDSRHPRSHVGP